MKEHIHIYTLKSHKTPILDSENYEKDIKPHPNDYKETCHLVLNEGELDIDKDIDRFTHLFKKCDTKPNIGDVLCLVTSEGKGYCGEIMPFKMARPNFPFREVPRRGRPPKNSEYYPYPEIKIEPIKIAEENTEELERYQKIAEQLNALSSM